MLSGKFLKSKNKLFSTVLKDLTDTIALEKKNRKSTKIDMKKKINELLVITIKFNKQKSAYFCKSNEFVLDTVEERNQRKCVCVC